MIDGTIVVYQSAAISLVADGFGSVSEVLFSANTVLNVVQFVIDLRLQITLEIPQCCDHKQLCSLKRHKGCFRGIIVVIDLKVICVCCSKINVNVKRMNKIHSLVALLGMLC